MRHSYLCFNKSIKKGNSESKKIQKPKVSVDKNGYNLCVEKL